MATTKTTKAKTSTGRTAKRSPVKNSTKKKATAKKSTAKKKAPEAASATVTVDRRRDDRRCDDRRKEDAPVVVERRTIQRREKVARRRQIDPTTCERDYSVNELEFMIALDEYKRASGRMFPTCSEVLEVLLKLGYEKRLQSAETTAEERSNESTPGILVSSEEPALEEMAV